MAIIPDDIKDDSNADLTQRVNTLYDYIRYLKEQLEFWGSNRNRDLNGLARDISDLDEAKQDAKTAATISNLNGGTIGAENVYGTKYINWADSDGNIWNMSVSDDGKTLSVSKYDGTTWNNAWTHDMTELEAPADIRLADLAGCQYKATGNASGTYTFNLAMGIYLVVIGKQNTTNNTYSGMYLVSIHSSSHVKTISESTSSTVTVSGSTLTVTTTVTYQKIIILRLLPNI